METEEILAEELLNVEVEIQGVQGAYPKPSLVFFFFRVIFIFLALIWNLITEDYDKSEKKYLSGIIVHEECWLMGKYIGIIWSWVKFNLFFF